MFRWFFGVFRLFSVVLVVSGGFGVFWLLSVVLMTDDRCLPLLAVRESR
jgi:hypothetical protein